MSSQKVEERRKLTKRQREARAKAVKASWAKRGNRMSYEVKKMSANASPEELTAELEEMALEGWHLHSIFNGYDFIFEMQLKKGS